jgi:hypothetical protein
MAQSTSSLMERELISQRDAAQSIVQELQKKLTETASIMEERVLRSETRRLETESTLRAYHDQLINLERHLTTTTLSILLGTLMGTCIGWFSCLLLFLVGCPPLLALLATGPLACLGALIGLGCVVATREKKERGPIGSSNSLDKNQRQLEDEIQTRQTRNDTNNNHNNKTYWWQHVHGMATLVLAYYRQ